MADYSKESNVYETEFAENVSKDGKTEMDFYKKLRRKINAYLDKHPNIGYAEYLAAVPDMFYLIVRLAFDGEVPASAKVKMAGAVAYFVAPIDIVPDFIPVAGWLDDLIVGVMLLNRTLDEIPQEKVDEYWLGKDNVYLFIKSVLEKGDKLIGTKAWNAIKKLLGKNDTNS